VPYCQKYSSTDFLDLLTNHSLYIFQLDTSEYPGFTECCDHHDICYDRCNEDRAECDKSFQVCLKDMCHFDTIHRNNSRKRYKECEGVADIIYAGTIGLGCEPYLSAQRNACLCDGKKISEKQMRKAQKGEL